MQRSAIGMNRLLQVRSRLPFVPVMFNGIALAMGLVLGSLGSLAATEILAITLVLVNLVILGQDEILAVCMIVLSILFDWYRLLGSAWEYPVLTTAAAAIFIGWKFFTQSPERPWIRTRYLWVWGVLLLLGALAIPRSVNLQEAGEYYIPVLVNSALMYIVGVQVATNALRFRRILSYLSILGSLIALQSILYEWTGFFFLSTPGLGAYLFNNQNFVLSPGSQTIRVGSYLLNPDITGVFFALMIFITLGLCAESSTWRKRAFYLVELALLMVGLLITFSTASLLAAGVGGVVAIFFIGRGRYRWYMFGGLGAAVLLAVAAFPSKIGLLLQHASVGSEFTLRLGIWETALRVIAAYPLTGVGLGTSTNYILRAEPFRVALQYRDEGHPHNSFLEVAAFMGLPALVAFLLLLGGAFRRMLRAYKIAPRSLQVLLGGTIVAIIAVCVNSLAIPGLTTPALAPIDWLLIGMSASPALIASEKPRVFAARKALSVPVGSEHQTAFSAREFDT